MSTAWTAITGQEWTGDQAPTELLACAGHAVSSNNAEETEKRPKAVAMHRIALVRTPSSPRSFFDPDRRRILRPPPVFRAEYP
jgi:hypothetical protein